MARRALVLTGSIGKGHDITTQVVAASLDRLGFDVAVLDCMALLGGIGARVGDWTFRRLLATAPVYDALHFSQFRTGGAIAGAMDRLATGRLVPALAGELAARPADLVVATFATGASAAAKLSTATHAEAPALTQAGPAAEAPARPPATVVLCIDAAPHRLWVQEGTDLFLVTSAAAAAAVRRYLPTARVEVVAAPVRAAFGSLPDRREARSALGIAPDARAVVLMGGGWGLGPLVHGAEALAAEGVAVLAVAGSNVAAHRALVGLAGRQPLVHPFGFTDRIPLLMAAADAVVTTPGATTCAEARAAGRPLVLVDVVPGHGRDNVQHELELGGADVCDATPTALAATVVTLLDRLLRPDGRGCRRVAPAPAQGRGPDAWEASFAAALAGARLFSQTTPHESPSGMDRPPRRPEAEDWARPDATAEEVG